MAKYVTMFGSMALCAVLCSAAAPVEGVFPSAATFGEMRSVKGERILDAFSIHAKLAITRGNLDEGFQVKSQPLPEYPPTAKRAGMVGEAVISLTIDENGSVKDVKLVKASPEQLGPPSLAAVGKWQFGSPKYKGKPTSLDVAATFYFSIYE
jgi:TonB family protein